MDTSSHAHACANFPSFLRAPPPPLPLPPPWRPGKFDKRLDEDKPGVRPRVGGRKRAFTPVADTARDRASMAAALGALQRKDALATNLDVGRAVNAVAKAPRPQGRHGAKAKLGGGKKQKR